MRLTRITLKKGLSRKTVSAAMQYLDTFVSGRYEIDRDDRRLDVIFAHPEDAYLFLNQSRVLGKSAQTRK